MPASPSDGSTPGSGHSARSSSARPSSACPDRPAKVAKSPKRPRVLVACQRCKTRRQRCDNASPACGNCMRAHAACLYSDRTAYPPSYVKALEARVKELEASAQQEQTPSGLPSGTPPAGTPGDRLVTGMGLLSSCAAAEPHYFGFSAGLSLAHFVQVALDFGSVASADVVSLPLLTDRPFSNQALHQKDAEPAALPSPKTGAAYIRAYLQLIHPLYPFLDRKQVWRTHRGARGENSLDGMDAALLHLVYAIGARCLQLVGTSSPPSSPASSTSEGHFLRAMQLIAAGLQFTSIRAIELTLLLALHSMRSPSGTSVWHLAGLALRQCIELGLHRRRPDDHHGDGHHRQCLFWSAYIFERKTALVLGRPFALADEEIDVRLPAGDAVRFHCAHVELYQLHTQIRRALYELKRGVDEPDEAVRQHHCAQLKATMERLFGQLDGWKARVLQAFPGEGSTGDPAVNIGHPLDTEDAGDLDNDDEPPDTATQQTELLLEYYKARRSLLQPLMTDGRAVYPFAPADYAAVAAASGQICQLYRRLHRRAPVPFSLRDLHAIFVAGFTLIYAICSAPALYTAPASTCARDIGACSTLLYVITEQWASAKKYRDAFEVVAETMEASVAEASRAMVLDGPAVLPPPPIPLYGSVPATPTDEHGLASGIGLDLSSDLYGIEGLLESEGLDWFTEAVF